MNGGIAVNLLVKEGVLEEQPRGANFSYILNDQKRFRITEYKVLLNQPNGSFVKCMKLLHNGKIELFYLVEGYATLAAMLSKLDSDQFVTVIGNLLAGVIDIKNNGFLSCMNIDGSFEHIYVDQRTLKVKLIYLPLNKQEHSDAALFETAIREKLIQAIERSPNLSGADLSSLTADLQNGRLSLEAIYSRLGEKGADQQALSTGEMKLVGLNTPTKLELIITKPEFTIGKKAGNDGIIGFNPMVSRVHCRISKIGSRFLISDLKSANGTYVNGVRLKPNSASLLNNGDVVRLADSEFRVVIA